MHSSAAAAAALTWSVSSLATLCSHLIQHPQVQYPRHKASCEGMLTVAAALLAVKAV